MEFSYEPSLLIEPFKSLFTLHVNYLNIIPSRQFARVTPVICVSLCHPCSAGSRSAVFRGTYLCL